MKLNIVMSNGKKAEIGGVRIGDFLVHRPAGFDLTDWHVTHIASRMRFPCGFATKAKATTFARQVKDLMDFSQVECGALERGTTKATWLKGEPTADQRTAVKALMQSLGE